MNIQQKPLVSVRNLVKQYGGKKGFFGGGNSFSINAIDDISFDIAPGETLGLVGESGSGKSTTGRVLLQLESPTAGDVYYKGQNIAGLKAPAMKPLRREMQIVFQDPYSALNPRMTVGDFVAEPLLIHEPSSAAERQEKTADLFRLVGLDPSFMSRYPHEFSGGQRQRVNIARAVALRPSFIVADEPITALDVSIQAQIINLFQDLQEELGLAYLFVAHDLSMVRYLCHRVAVMLRGKIVEMAPVATLFEDPRHPYTQALLTAIPVPDPRIERARRHIAFDLNLHGPKAGQKLQEVTPEHFVLM